MNLKELILKFRRLIIAVIHLALIICAYILAFYLRFDFKINSSDWQVIVKTLPTRNSSAIRRTYSANDN